MMRRSLFEEHHFSWPEEKKGNPKLEAKLPYFWFTDVGEAKTYLQLWWLWQSVGGLMFINFWFLKNTMLGWFLFVCLIGTQAAFMRVWVPLCRRAGKNVSKWDWFAANWFNPKSRHCLLMAWDLVKQAQEESKQENKSAFR